MQTISSTQNLVPLIEGLLRNLTEIASILKADLETATPVNTETPEKTTTASPKSPSSPQKKPTKTPDSLAESSEEAKPVYTIEQVRAVLAEKSQAGLTFKVKDLLTSFGAEKLSGIDPARYGELINAAKTLQ